jgi:hypothetical protein
LWKTLWALIAASEDPIKGTSRKGNIFVATMAASTLFLYRRKEARDRADSSRTSAVVCEEQLSPYLVCSHRDVLSIYKRFKVIISPRVIKFIAIEKQQNWNLGGTKKCITMPISQVLPIGTPNGAILTIFVCPRNTLKVC